MALIPLLLLTFASSSAGQATVLPSICNNPDYECIRAIQRPPRYSGNSFLSTIPDPPPAPPPMDYGLFASESEFIALRTQQGTDAARHGIYPPDAPFCYFHFDAPDAWPQPQYTAGGFLVPFSQRSQFYSWAWTPIGFSSCGQVNHDAIREQYWAPIVCPAGWSNGSDPTSGPFCYQLKKAGCCKINTKVGNPIDVFLKNKIQRDQDFAGPGLLQVDRLYRNDGFTVPVGAAGAPSQPFGPVWRSHYERQLVEAQGSGALIAQISREDGKTFYFRETAGVYQGNPDSPGQLTRIRNSAGISIGWTFESAAGEIESYDASGIMSRIDRRDGSYITLAYNSDHRLSAVVDEKGRALHFTYDALGRATSVTLPDGNAINYEYNVANAISIVHYPGGGTRIYRYDDARSILWLTSIVDENGRSFATFTYDGNGYPLSSTHAGGANRVQVVPGAVAYDDALGTRHAFTVESVANAQRVTSEALSCSGCPALSKAIHYDSIGNIDSETDFSGNRTTFVYDAQRFLNTSRTEAVNDTSISSSRRTTQTDWHASFRVPTEKRVYNASMALQSRTAWTYNARGQVLTKTELDPIAAHAARVWAYSYCEAANVSAGTCPLVGLLTQVDGSRSDVSDLTRYTYRSADEASCATGGACTYRRGDLWKVTNALGQVMETVSYDKNGRATRIKDANGTLTDLAYHPRGWLASRIVRANADGSISALDATTAFTYDAVGNVIRVTQPDGAYLNYTYDDAHRLTDIADNLNNRIHYTLDAAGNRTAENTYDPSSVLKRTLSRSYSSLNRLQRTTDALAHSTTFGYDANGNAISTVDALNTETDQQVDPLNRLVRTLQDVTAPTGTSTRNTTTQYAYDARDNLTDVTDPDNLLTHYVYDGQNNLTQLQSPDTGTTSYTVDAAGNRISQTDARGITTNYSYDALNRLTAIRYPTASLNVTFQYDNPPNECIAGETFTIGRLAKMIDASGETHYCYDRRGNPTRKVQLTNLSFSCGLNTCGGGTTSSVDAKRGVQSAIIAPGTPNPTNTTVLTLTTRYAYTLADRLSAMTYPSGLQVTYVRNAIGQINQISYKPTPTAATTAILSSATYLPFGPINTLTFGNGRRQTKSYDQNYGIDAISSTSAGGLTLDFSLDAMGNVQDASNALGLTPPTQRYRYDDLYRLTEVDNSAAAILEGYSYTKTGDRTRKTKQGQADQIYVYPTTSHRLQSVAGTARSYDADGNLTSMGLSYDARNRLAGWQLQPDGTINLVSNSVQYQYNGKGERVAKQSVTYDNAIPLPGEPSGWLLGGQAYTYGEGGQITGEYSVTGQAIVEYLYLDNQPIAIQKTNKLYYIETDHLNTPRQVIDPTRNVTVWRWDFFGSAFGENGPNQDPDADGIPFVLNLRFPGQYYDQETNLNYNYFRDYEPTTGRYVESDPIGLNGGVSTYAYVGLSPLKNTDPAGLDFWVESGVPGKEGGGGYHRSLCVGNPNGKNRCFSFGAEDCTGLMDCWNAHGSIYEDMVPGGEIDSSTYRKTSLDTDSKIESELATALGKRGRYWLLGNNCRDWSYKKWWEINLKYLQFNIPAVAPPRN